MKNNHRSFLLLLGMVAFAHSSAFASTGDNLAVKKLLKAQQEEQKSDEKKDGEQKDEKISDAQELKGASGTVVIPDHELEHAQIDFSKIPSLIKAKKLKEIVSLVEPEQAEKLGLGVDFAGDKMIVTGTLSSACGSMLSLDTKKDVVSSASSSEDDDADASADAKPKDDDVKGQASRVSGRLVFHGNEIIKSLDDCIKLDEDGEKSDLSKDAKLSRSVLDEKESAIGGLMGSSNKVDFSKKFAKSAQYKKFESQFKKLNCKECNADPDSLRARINELKSINSPLVASLLPKLLEMSINEAGDRISTAKNIKALEAIRSDLGDLAELIPGLKISSSEKEKQLGDISTRFTELLSRNQEITSTSPKATVEQSRSADFMSQTYEAMAKLPGMDADSREEAQAKADSYKKGHDRRIEYLSMINANHPDVTRAMVGMTSKEEKLRAAKDDACNQYKVQPSPQGSQVPPQMVPNPHFSFVACGDAKPAYDEFMATYAPLKQRVDLAQAVSTGLMGQQNVLNGMQPQWFNQPAPMASNVNNLFTLDPRVFPNANQYNQNSGIAGQNQPLQNVYPQQNTFLYGNPSANSLVYNQAYNNPNFRGSNVSVNPPQPIIVNSVNGVNNTNTQSNVGSFQPTFIVN